MNIDQLDQLIEEIAILETLLEEIEELRYLTHYRKNQIF